MTKTNWWAAAISALLLIIILAAINLSSGASSAPITAELLSFSEANGVFERATGPRNFDFPADLGPHPEYQTEWWYYTGNLESADGRRFGYQLTFFRRALETPDEGTERSSAWAADQIYMGHFALSDVANEDFYAFERFSRAAAGLAGAETYPYQVWLENWRVEQSAEGSYLMHAAADGIEIELSLVDTKGPVLQGESGYSRKGPEAGNASFYYSQTRLLTTGSIRIHGESIEVRGLSWKDHEFSTSALSTGQEGWDWFSVQLDNGYELMVYQLRRTDGSVDRFSSGSLIAPDGQVRTLDADDFAVSSNNSWTSPHSGASYPMGWRLTVPSAELELTLTPLFEDQELNLSFTYWEGAVSVSGSLAGAALSGEGYVEMTGYAQSLEGQF